MSGLADPSCNRLTDYNPTRRLLITQNVPVVGVLQAHSGLLKPTIIVFFDLYS